MCGIYGSTSQFSEDIIREKLMKINFRGPDYSEYQILDGVILGHNRLAILDLDKRSNQPFSYVHLTIVFNGEIYNYQDLKNDLLKKGYRFQTASDTEVICAAYLAYGKSCVNYFNGMFSFAIYDQKTREIFGARDRLGKKPFYYYYYSGNDFEFASQPAQLAIGRKFSVDQEAVSEYFIWGYIPEPRSIWKEVKKLPAGHLFTYSMNSGNLQIEKYWDLDYSWTKKFGGSYQDAKGELSSLLADAVKIRMHADVPLGVFLSGGIDSSLIASLAAKEVNHVKTFSIQFNEKGFDESKYAERVASFLGTEHHTIACNYDEGIDLIKNFSNYYDEPFADSSAIPSMLLSKYTRRHVTVALSGDGGDEGFLGYLRYQRTKLVQSFFKLPLPLRKLVSKSVCLSPKYTHKLIGMGLAIKDLRTLYMKMFGGLEYSWVSNPELGVRSQYADILINREKPLLENLSDFDIKTYLNDDINTKVDRASMAFSLESRAPLMDYRIIEFARSLPSHFKFHKGVQKRILKDVLYQYAPKYLFDRPKSGFTMPFKEWFRNELKEYVLDNLSQSALKDIPGINVTRAQEIINQHMTEKWNRYPEIWKMLVLKQWLSNYKAVQPSKELVTA